MSNPYCIHTYWAMYGFADFLRGTIAIYYFCKKYNYDLYIDTSSSSIFNYLNINNKYVLQSHIKHDSEQVKFYKYNNPGMLYPEIYIKLEETFKEGKSFVVSTNSMYKLGSNGIPMYWGDLEYDCKQFMKEILQPVTLINNQIQNVFNNVYNIKENEPFKVIHIRCGDNFHKEFNNEEYLRFHNQICKYIENDKDINYVLVCDNIYLGNNLSKNIPLLKYWENIKGHTGVLKGTKNNDAMINTVCDYFIMSMASELLPLGPNGSGFSLSTSLIFGSKLKNVRNI